MSIFGYGYGYGYGSHIALIVMTILALLFAVAAAVLAAIFILPKKKREKHKGFLALISDFINFKRHGYGKYYKDSSILKRSTSRRSSSASTFS